MQFLSILFLTLLPKFISSQLLSTTTNFLPTMCRTSSDCPSGCCKQSLSEENYNLYGYVYSGTCALSTPDDTQPCSENCPCKRGLVCTENFLCRKCSKICMVSEIYNKYKTNN